MGTERKRFITEKEKQLIEGYFNDTLGKQETNQFTELLSQDKNFVLAVEQYREMALHIDSIAEQQLLQGLEMDITQLENNEDMKNLLENYPGLHKRVEKLLNRGSKDNKKEE